jgi:ABC-type multidrug transport system fused ATPase/permease subunit
VRLLTGLGYTVLATAGPVANSRLGIAETEACAGVACFSSQDILSGRMLPLLRSLTEAPVGRVTVSTAPAATLPPAAGPAAGVARDEGRERGHGEQLSRLVPYVRRHRALLALTFGLSLFLAVIDVPVPFVLKHLIDATLSRRHTLTFLGHAVAPEQFLLGIFTVLAGLALGKGVLVYIQRVASETIGQRVVFEMRLDLYRHLQSLSMRWFREARTGKLMLRLIGDINAVLDMITDGYLRALMDMITVFAVVISIFTVNWQLACIVLATMPIYVAAFLRLSKRLRKSGRAARRERSALSGHLQERIAGAAIVKAFVQEEAESGRVEEQTGRLRDRLIEKARWGGLLSAVANTTVALGAALVLWIGGRQVLAGTMSREVSWRSTRCPRCCSLRSAAWRRRTRPIRLRAYRSIASWISSTTRRRSRSWRRVRV